MRSAARPVAPAPPCLWCSAALATTASRSGQPCCIFCLTSSAADGDSIGNAADTRVHALCSPPPWASGVPAAERLEASCSPAPAGWCAEAAHTRASQRLWFAAEATPLRRTPRARTVQDRQRRRRSAPSAAHPSFVAARVAVPCSRPRLGSPDGCGAARRRLAMTERARGARVPTVPGGAARIGRTGGMGGSSCRHAARRRSFPGSCRSSFCRGSLPTLALARGYLAQNHFVEQARNKKSPGLPGVNLAPERQSRRGSMEKVD